MVVLQQGSYLVVRGDNLIMLVGEAPTQDKLRKPYFEVPTENGEAQPLLLTGCSEASSPEKPEIISPDYPKGALPWKVEPKSWVMPFIRC